MPVTVALIGTLDTKGLEYGYLRDRLIEQDVVPMLIDTGILGTPRVTADIDRDRVAQAAGSDIASLAKRHDRDQAIATMQQGAAKIVQQLVSEGSIQGVIGLGGSSGSTLVSGIMRALPVGFPKMLVSTVASGDTRPYVGTSDIAMMSSIVDISGLNRLSEPILANAAGAIAGMARAHAAFVPSSQAKPLIGATMFGVTTPGVTVARERLEALGYEVLVFHATGVGGDTMESLIAAGVITGVLDMTTTEFVDAQVGGVLPAGPDRLLSAGRAGYPMVVSLGALDMANFGPVETVPEHYRQRKLHRHNASITLMRTALDEAMIIATTIAERLNQSRGPVTVFIPGGGVSMIDVPGEPFYDAGIDAALFDVLRNALDPRITVIESDADINDPAFATAMANELDRLYGLQHTPAGEHQT